MHFVVGFRNSMAEKGFTFKKIEGFTQLGLHYFTHAYEGRYGEVVDVLPDKLGKFKRVHTDANGKIIISYPILAANPVNRLR